MKTVGLFDQDARIHFVSSDFIIINNPYNGGAPTLVKRCKGEPTEKDWVKIRNILSLMNMELTGNKYIREDGLYCYEVKEVGDDKMRS